ncbi:MAG TPA: hypothetical protein VKG44_08505 [Candidatus Baltobacteraceae bacterium]|nr:hypothetical protein [Candidatus Baltobacteraceae bacterium]
MRPALLRRSLLLIALLAVTLGVVTTAVSAKTYSRGHTVWFHDTEISDGDAVDGDLNVLFANVTCGQGGSIQGNVNVYFGSFDQLDGCEVGGAVNYLFDPTSLGMFAPWTAPGDVTHELFAQNRRILEQLAWDVVVVFAFLLFPMRVRVALDRVERHPMLSAGTGIVALIAVIPIAILLLLSVIGIPLIVLEFAALFAGVWIGQAAVALLLGRRLYELTRPHTTPSPLGALILGLVLVSAAEILPVVGWAVMALVWLIGLGAAILGCWRELPFGPPVSASPPLGGAPMNRPA